MRVQEALTCNMPGQRPRDMAFGNAAEGAFTQLVDDDARGYESEWKSWLGYMSSLYVDG